MHIPVLLACRFWSEFVQSAHSRAIMKRSALASQGDYHLITNVSRYGARCGLLLCPPVRLEPRLSPKG